MDERRITALLGQYVQAQRAYSVFKQGVRNSAPNARPWTIDTSISQMQAEALNYKGIYNLKRKGKGNSDSIELLLKEGSPKQIARINAVFHRVVNEKTVEEAYVNALNKANAVIRYLGTTALSEGAETMLKEDGLAQSRLTHIEQFVEQENSPSMQEVKQTEMYVCGMDKIQQYLGKEDPGSTLTKEERQEWFKQMREILEKPTSEHKKT